MVLVAVGRRSVGCRQAGALVALWSDTAVHIRDVRRVATGVYILAARRVTTAVHTLAPRRVATVVRILAGRWEAGSQDGPITNIL